MKIPKIPYIATAKRTVSPFQDVYIAAVDGSSDTTKVTRERRKQRELATRLISNPMWTSL